MAYIYFIANERKSVVKIGVANRPNKRLKTFQTAHYEELIILRVIKVSTRTLAFQLESALHKKFKRFHIRGEWFKLTATVHNFIEDFQEEKSSVMEKSITFLASIILMLGVVLIGVVILK